MRPVVDQELCIGCGACEEICPDVFQVGDDGFSHVIAADPAAACAAAGCCEEAVEECPVDAISLIDD
jgi:ferredoxin